MFHVRLKLSGVCCGCQGCAAVAKDVFHVLEKANPYDTIVQTTNQAATRVQSLIATAEYQVAELQIQIWDHIPGINILVLTPKVARRHLIPETLLSIIFPLHLFSATYIIFS